MNEIVFIVFSLFVFSLLLFALRLGGVAGVIGVLVFFGLLLNIFVVKQFNLFGWAVTGGNILYGAIFLGTDILSEHYGKKIAYKAVIIGLVVTLGLAVFSQVLISWQPNDFDESQLHLKAIFDFTPRIAIASLIAFFIAQINDVWLFNWLRTKFSQIWIRNLGSTLVSQIIDTLIFTALGLTAFAWLPFAGIIEPELFWQIFVSTYVIKVLVALIDTPFLYLSYRFLPKQKI